MISVLATVYLFLGGAGGGGVVVLSALELMRLSTRQSYFASEIHPDSYARAWMAALAFLVLGILSLSLDLGRIDRVLLFLLSPSPSPLVVGAFSLCLSVVIALFFAHFENFEGVFWPRMVLRALSIAGILFGSITIVYTGFLLWLMPSVVAWQSPLLPVLFALSSCSCGVALILGFRALSNDSAISVRVQQALVRIDTAIILAEMVIVAFFVGALFLDDRSAAAGKALLCGDLSLCFWAGFMLLGLIVPLLLERIDITRRRLYLLMWITGCVLIGAAALRFWVVGMSFFDPTSVYATGLPEIKW